MEEPEGGYKKFKLGVLFDIASPKRKFDANKISFGGKYPYVVRTSENNGIRGLITEDERFLNNGNTISFGQDTATIFYQRQPYFTGDKIKVFTYKDSTFNETISIYLIATMRKAFSNFSWGNTSFNVDVLNNVEVQLPVKRDKTIDYKYIEESVSKLEEEHLQELEAYLQEASFDDCTLSTEEIEALLAIERGEKQVRKFAIVKEFKVSNSHNILKSDVVFDSGATPYVTASEGNNSIVSYISYKPDMIEQGNSIMIGGKTLVITYQPRDFFSNDSHNLVLTINDERGRNESAQLYMVASLYKTLGPKYSWGDSISKAKIQKDVVFLPITDDGNSIDYVFMETYINAIKKQCIANLKETIGQENEVIKKSSIFSDYNESSMPLMAAEDIYIYGSIPVDLPNTNRNELIGENLDLILMYAIPPTGRQKAEAAKKIAIGIKESMLSDEQIASYKSVKHLMFHYWSNPKAYHLTKEPLLVDRDKVPSDYTIRMEKDAVKFLLLEYDLQNPSELGSIDILKTQRRGEIRYLPFVTTIDSIRID